MCNHSPQCPVAEATDHDAAKVVAHDPKTGYSLLCNGVITFEDGGEIAPDGHVTDANRGPAPHAADDLNLRIDLQILKLKLVEAQLRVVLAASQATVDRHRELTERPTPDPVPTGVIAFMKADPLSYAIWVGLLTYSMVVMVAAMAGLIK